MVKPHTQSFLNGFADFKKLVIFVLIWVMSYLYQEIIYSFLSEIAAAFVLHQLEVWDYNYKQTYLCILPPPTFSPSLLPSTAGLLLSEGGRSYGRWSRGTAAHLARPSRGKGTGESTWPFDKEHYVTMIQYKNTYTQPATESLPGRVKTQMVKFHISVPALSRYKQPWEFFQTGEKQAWERTLYIPLQF